MAYHVEDSKVVHWPDNLPYDKQSVPVPGTKKPGQTAHYINGAFGLITVETPHLLKTMDEVFANGLRLGNDRPFLGYRPLISKNPNKFGPYKWYSYGEVDLRRRYIGSALTSMYQSGELVAEDYESVGIWSQNRPEWQIIELGLQTHGKVSVSLYDTFGADSVEYVVRHAHLTAIFSTSDHLPVLLSLVHKVPFLKLIVCIDELAPEALKLLKAWGSSLNVRVLSLPELEQIGKDNLVEPMPSTPDAVATICYTSGTTNNPKGAILKHKNLALSAQSNLFGIVLTEDASLFSYLPLAHIYERICEACTIAVGGRIGYFTGDTLRLLEDAQALKPNFFPSVPRVLNRVYQAAIAGGSVGGLKTLLFQKAVQAKLDRLHTTGDSTHAFWDRLVFKKIQAVLGGQLKLVTSGSAPISREVIDFLKIAFACQVDEGDYGMTENCGTCAKTWPNDATASGTVGPPQPINEVKLVDVAAMGYTAEDRPNPRGELCIRGDNCFSFYHKDPEATKYTVDDDGWMHTGDVAEIDQCGRIKIIDRVKNIMKLAQGEYVALEKIENIFSATPNIAQIYVHGDSLQSYLLAVVVPDPVQLSTLAAQLLNKKVSPENLAELQNICKDPRINAHILGQLTAEAKRNKLQGFEMIRRIHLSIEPFSVENGTMTPTMKVRRKDAYAKYKSELDGLYALGEPGSSTSPIKL